MIYISRKSTLFKSFTYVSMYTLHTGTNSMQLLICQRFNRIFSICVKMFNEFWTHFCEFIEMNAKIYVQTHAFDGHPSNPSKKKNNTKFIWMRTMREYLPNYLSLVLLLPSSLFSLSLHLWQFRWQSSLDCLVREKQLWFLFVCALYMVHWIHWCMWNDFVRSSMNNEHWTLYPVAGAWNSIFDYAGFWSVFFSFSLFFSQNYFQNVKNFKEIFFPVMGNFKGIFSKQNIQKTDTTMIKSIALRNILEKKKRKSFWIIRQIRCAYQYVAQHQMFQIDQT